MRSTTRGLIEVHISVMLFGLAGLFGKYLTMSAVGIVFGRVLFAAIALAVFLRLRRQSIRLGSARDYLLFAPLGAILAIHWATFFHSIHISTVAIGLITFSTFPVFVTFLEPLVSRQRLQLGDVLIAACTLGGVALVVPEFDVANDVTKGVIWGVISGFTFAVLTLLNRRYVQTYTKETIAFYQDVVAAALLLPFVLIAPPSITPQDLLLLILLGVVFTAVAHALFIGGLQHIRAQAASVIASLESVYGIIFAALLLGEIPTLRTLMGGAIVLGAALVVTMRRST